MEYFPRHTAFSTAAIAKRRAAYLNVRRLFMAKKPAPGKCVHCVGQFEKLTWDHVFPESWYPDTTPDNLYKWQIPNCIRCNQEYGKIEKDLMIRVGLCLDPNDPSCAGIVDKALRSIDHTKGKNHKDKQARLKKRQQILGQMLH